MKIVLIAGARPNFMKIAPIMGAIDRHNAQSPVTIHHTLVHTGQHYDYEMSQVFFKELAIPEPDFHLGIGSGTHAEQTGKAMIAIEKVLLEHHPNVVVVVGDVNSTLAGALAAAKLQMPVAHVEAGLRSFDRTMPEETNRLLTDAISDYLFTPSADADDNLRREGIPESKIFLVGNVMVDSLMQSRSKAQESPILSRLELEARDYALLTLHRPGNVDDEQDLRRIVEALAEIARRIPVVFPAHPRTLKKMKEFRLLERLPIEGHRFLLIEPLGYLDFINLEINARFVLTDSGGIQEETTVLNVPCLTLRDGTERPITVAEGTNILVGSDKKRILDEAHRILDGHPKQGRCPDLWDGKAAERIVAILARQEKP